MKRRMVLLIVLCLCLAPAVETESLAQRHKGDCAFCGERIASCAMTDAESALSALAVTDAVDPALAQVASDDLFSALRGYWNLDEVGGQRQDGSGYGNDLDAHNAVGSAAGRVHLAADLERSGEQYLYLDDALQSGLDITGSLTLAGWVNPESLGQWQVMAAKYEYGVRNRAYRFDLRPGNALGFIVSPDGTYDESAYLLQVHPPFGLRAVTWYHVAGVFDAAQRTLSVYLDGKLIASRPVSYDRVYDASAPLMLGADMYRGRATQYLDGRLDEWYVFARALSGAEIAALRALAFPLPTVPGAPHPAIGEMIDQVQATTVYSYVAALSGEWPAIVGGTPYTIATRHSYSSEMISLATRYAYEHLAGLGLDVAFHAYSWDGHDWRNVVAEQPGLAEPDRIWVIAAHIDDLPPGPVAPGADDNASGSVAVLVAADILSRYRFGYTLRYVLFSGEEQGRRGSTAYAAYAYANGEDIEGVLNLDMIGYNSDLVPVVDLHARSDIPASVGIAEVFSQVVTLYGLDLAPDILIDYPLGNRSDNKSFWDQGYPAILATEDYDDMNPFYHQITDCLSMLDPTYLAEYIKAAVGTLAHMGCFYPACIEGAVPEISTETGGTVSVYLPFIMASGHKLEEVAPEASFASSSPDVLGEATAFANLSRGSNLRYAWDLGDGSPIEAAAHPSHTYAAAGTFAVVLTATNSVGSDVFAAPVVIVEPDLRSPLELSGLAPIWEEHFAEGTIGRMQYSWATGNHDALASYVMPGAVYLGNEGGRVEQQINNYKSYDGEPLPQTIEFDVLNPIGGEARVSLRPWRRRDFAHIYVGNPGDTTRVHFTFLDGASIAYAEPTGPSLGWAHVTVSYRQYASAGTTYAHYVVAINEEVHEHHAPSGITDPDWATYWGSTADADGWSIEYDSRITTMGRYIARVQAYSDFLTLSEMESRLQGRVAGYLTTLPDPRDYTAVTKAFQAHKDLDLYGPNAMAYAEPLEGLTVRFDGSLSSSWGKIASYAWEFGDGDSASGRVVTHTYAQPGTYQAQLTVSNAYGADVHRIAVTIPSPTLPADQKHPGMERASSDRCNLWSGNQGSPAFCDPVRRDS